VNNRSAKAQIRGIARLIADFINGIDPILLKNDFEGTGQQH
jgi:hypothetical protein